jgi:hypothetical protein
MEFFSGTLILYNFPKNTVTYVSYVAVTYVTYVTYSTYVSHLMEFFNVTYVAVTSDHGTY